MIEKTPWHAEGFAKFSEPRHRNSLLEAAKIIQHKQGKLTNKDNSTTGKPKISSKLQISKSENKILAFLQLK